MATEPHAPRRALLIDWGGVLTTNLFASFHAHCVRRRASTPTTLMGRFGATPPHASCWSRSRSARSTSWRLRSTSPRCSEVDPNGLVDGLFAGVHPDEAMLEAVRKAHDAGIRTALVSNSWGVHRYPHELFAELFDGIVISGEERIRKPTKRMYELGAERAGVPPEQCVFVDDLPFNLTPAEELGMATVHHTSAETTIPELERILGVPLGASAEPVA